MSEPIPESIPTSADRRSRRPLKRRALTPKSELSARVDALFANPTREIILPGPARPKTLAPPPEVVANVQGSSAGAGSGEFHVYKAARRKEYERLRMMDEQLRTEKADDKFETNKTAMKKLDEERTRKNRAKREKQKARKSKAKGPEPANGVTQPVQLDGKIESESKPREANGKETSASPEPTTQNGNVKVVEEIGLIIQEDD